MEYTVESLVNMRKRLGWSIFDLARRLGCSPDDVQSWENGSSTPDIQILSKFFQFQMDLEFHSENLSQSPKVDKVMKERGISQISFEEIQEDVHSVPHKKDSSF